MIELKVGDVLSFNVLWYYTFKGEKSKYPESHKKVVTSIQKYNIYFEDNTHINLSDTINPTLVYFDETGCYHNNLSDFKINNKDISNFDIIKYIKGDKE